MKKIRLLFVFIIILLCGRGAKGQSSSLTTKDNLKKLDWLQGTWVRTNAKTGRTGHERWLKSPSGDLQGYGVTLNGKDTISFEKIKIKIERDTLFYVADVPENQKPVYFRLNQITETGFACENPDHDFPKKITYQLDGIKLKASISGDGRAIDYLFEKK